MKRRDTLGLILAGCLAPALGSRTAWARSRHSGLINPPAEPMRFVRTLRRSLAAGHNLTVSRAFSVRFSPVTEGYSLFGAQADVLVDLPEQLAAFAELERARDESGMFPIGLNGFGEIVTAHAPRPTCDQVEEAVTHALASIDAQDHPEGERQRLREFASAVHNSSGAITAHMPVDLFAPEAGLKEHSQQLALGEGLEGVVRTAFNGECDAETGLMRSAWREIATVVGDDERVTREEWTLDVA